MLLAKLSLFDPIDIDLLRECGAADAAQALRLDPHTRINALGIGAQGLGGLSPVIDVKVRTAPCHAAAIPVALAPNCAATRHLRLRLNGSGSSKRCWPASARVLAFEDLGMEAVHEFEPADFPVTVAVGARGRAIHRFKVEQ